MLVDQDTFATGRAISEAEWAEIRRADVARGEDHGEEDEVLLRYQRKLLETTALNQITICEKSRRTGMTWAAALDAVLTASSTREAGGMDVLYMGYNLDMAREFVDTCAEWIEASGKAAKDAKVDIEGFVYDDGSDHGVQAFRIRRPSGFEIAALTSKPRSLRGRQGYLILDEAAFHEQLQQVVDAAVPFLMWGGKILVISTHFGEDNPFNHLIEDARAGRKPYAVLRVTLDDALRDGLHQRICRKTGETWSPEAEAAWRAKLIAAAGPEAADEEFFCIPSQGGGAVLNGALIEARMADGIPVLRLERPASWLQVPEPYRRAEVEDWCEQYLRPLLDKLDPNLPSYLGGDFGRLKDLTVFWPLQTLRNMKRWTPFVVELRNIPFEQQWQIGRYIADRLPRFSKAHFDAIGIGMQISEAFAVRYGLARAEPVKLSPTWYIENVPPLRAAFEDDAIVIPRDLDTKKDLQLPVLKGGVPTMPPIRVVGTDGKSRHGDSFVALLMAYTASRATPQEYDYRTTRDFIREERRGGHDDDDAISGGRALW